MKKIEAIIFDADGVIFDSEKLWDIGDSEFLNRRGLDKFPDGLKTLLAGTSILEGTALLLKNAGTMENLEEAAMERVKIMEKLYATQTEFVSGFPDFLSFVKSKNLRTAVATSMNRSLFPLINEKTKFLDLFEGKVYSVNDVANAKPAPDVYLHAAKMINVLPENSVVIEDSPNGIKSAKAAGMFCIGFATTFETENLHEADVVFKNFDEIKRYIENVD